MTRRKDTVFWCWLCLAMAQYVPCFCTTPYIATTAAQWTLFSGLNLSWNEASHFCKSLGGHLPVFNTKLRMNAFITAAVTWNKEKLLSRDVWTGLFSTTLYKEPNRWEADCSLQPDGLKFWGTSEPNDLDQDICTRYQEASQKLFTKDCGDQYNVVCEFDKGSCHKNTQSGSLRAPPQQTVSLSGFSMESCWEQCMSFPPTSIGLECVGALFGNATCVGYLGDTLVSILSTMMNTSTTTMLKSCFDGNVSKCCVTYSYVDKSNSPRPAGDPCTTTAAQSTTVAATQPQRSEESTAEETKVQSNDEPKTEATWPIAEISSSTDPEARGTLAASSSDLQEGDMLTMVSDRKTTTEDGVERETTFKNKDSLRTEFLSTSSDLIGYRHTTVSDDIQDGSSSKETSPTKVSQPLLCPCMKFESNMSVMMPTSITQRSNTSKYRRSRNSEWGSPSTYTSTSSATFVIVVGVVGFLFVVCDINRLTSFCGKNCCKTTQGGKLDTSLATD